MKKKIVVFILLALIITVVNPVYASETPINSNNIKEIMTQAEQGDKGALVALQNLEMFNEQLIDEKLAGRTFRASQGNQIIEFSDGSRIRIEFSPQATRSNYMDSCSYVWEVGGIDMARYTIGAEWHNLSLPDYCTLDDSWDTSAGMAGATAYESDTQEPIVSGRYVKVTGTGGYDFELIHVRKKFEFIGYPYGDCSMTMVN